MAATHNGGGGSVAFAGNWREHGLGADERVVSGDSGRPKRNRGGRAMAPAWRKMATVAEVLHSRVAVEWKGEEVEDARGHEMTHKTWLRAHQRGRLGVTQRSAARG